EIVQRGRKARPHGTTVTVHHLFYNVPARLNFLGKARTENGHVMQLLQRYAAGYPALRFSLLIDEHIVLQTSGSGDLATTLTELYRLTLKELLDSVDESDGERYRLHGSIGNRVLAQSNRQYATLFVNGRWVQVRSLHDAL